MMSKMDEVFRKVLNDRNIFDTPYDGETKAPIPKLFEGASWKELGRLFNEGRKDEFTEKIDNRIREIENQEQRAHRWRRDKINELNQRTKWLKSASENKSHLLKQLFENLEWYGLVECYLPSMDDYGKVIERHDISTVEHYFIDKIKREVSYKHRQRYISKRGKALEKVFEYVKELYNSGLHPVEIAFFVRKLNSLVTYWEAIE
ncbi:hypothetical protein J7K43_06405 [Candidatus Calescamantes bacterium]|nr:hypothetical protein [Candidatus Calescamantes bacterium]